MHEIFKNIHILMKKLLISLFFFFLQLFYFLAKLGSQEWKKILVNFHTIQSLVHLCNPLTMTFSYLKWSHEPCISVHSCSKIIFALFFTFFLVYCHPVQIQQIQDKYVSFVLFDMIQRLHSGRQICRIPTYSVLYSPNRSHKFSFF